jgi:uncharacterized protein HemX
VPVAATPSRRDVAFAAFLAVVLGIGVLGVLLLNTAMQQQAHRLALQHDKLANLSLEAQTLYAELQWAADPHRLEAKARELHLRPAIEVRYVDPGSTERRTVSERKRAATRDRAG